MGEARMVAGRFWHDKDIPIALGLLTQRSRISKPKTSSLIGRTGVRTFLILYSGSPCPWNPGIAASRF
jgi:hypothetical protein